MTPTDSAYAALATTVESLRAAIALHNNSAGHLELARDAVQWQQGMAVYGLTVVVAVASILLVATWIYNLRTSNRRIDDAVARAQEKLRGEMANATDARFTALGANLKAEIEMKLHILSGDRHRLLGLSCFGSKQWSTAATWVAKAVIDYARAGDGELVRAAVDGLLHSLNSADHLDTKERAVVQLAINSMPGVLSLEREAITKRVEELSISQMADQGQRLG
jgi:hypothetical protein